MPVSIKADFGHEKISKSSQRQLAPNIISFATKVFWLLLPGLPRCAGVKALYTDPSGLAMRDNHIRNIQRRIGNILFGYPTLPSQIRRAVITVIAQHFGRHGTVEAFRLGLWIAARLSNTSVETAETNYLLLELEYDMAILYMEMWLSPMADSDKPLSDDVRTFVQQQRENFAKNHVARFREEHNERANSTDQTSVSAEFASSSPSTSTNLATVASTHSRPPSAMADMPQKDKTALARAGNTIRFKLDSIEKVRFNESGSEVWILCRLNGNKGTGWFAWTDKFLRTKAFWSFLEKEAQACVAWNYYPFNVKNVQDRLGNTTDGIMMLPAKVTLSFDENGSALPLPSNHKRIKYAYQSSATLANGYVSWLKANVWDFFEQFKELPMKSGDDEKNALVYIRNHNPTYYQDLWIPEFIIQQRLGQHGIAASVWLAEGTVFQERQLMWDDPSIQFTSPTGYTFPFTWDSWRDLVQLLKMPVARGAFLKDGAPLKWSQVLQQVLYPSLNPSTGTQTSIMDFAVAMDTSSLFPNDPDDSLHEIDDDEDSFGIVIEADEGADDDDEDGAEDE